jgi:hypothetical protein
VQHSAKEIKREIQEKSKLNLFLLALSLLA